MASTFDTDLGKREPYQRFIAVTLELFRTAALFESLATLEDVLDFLDENISVLVDDAVDLNHHDTRREVGLHRPLSLGYTPAARKAAAQAVGVIYYRRREHAISRARAAIKELEAIQIDAMALSERGHLADAISNAKEAFRRLAQTPGDRRLLVAAKASLQSINEHVSKLEHLGRQRTAAVSGLATVSSAGKSIPAHGAGAVTYSGVPVSPGDSFTARPQLGETGKYTRIGSVRDDSGSDLPGRRYVAETRKARPSTLSMLLEQKVRASSRIGPPSAGRTFPGGRLGI